MFKTWLSQRDRASSFPIFIVQIPPLPRQAQLYKPRASSLIRLEDIPKDSQRKPCKFNNRLLQARASLLRGTTDQMWLVSHQDLGELNRLNTKGSTFRRKVRRSDCRVRSTETSCLSSGLEWTGIPVKGAGGNDVSVFQLQPFKEEAFSFYILPLKLSQQEFLLSHKETMLPHPWTAFPTWETTLLILTVAGTWVMFLEKSHTQLTSHQHLTLWNSEEWRSLFSVNFGFLPRFLLE